MSIQIGDSTTGLKDSGNGYGHDSVEGSLLRFLAVERDVASYVSTVSRPGVLLRPSRNR
jgi:hypothetical protein